MSGDTEGFERESQRSGPVVQATRWLENLGETAFAYFLLIPLIVLLSAIALYPLLRTFEFSLYRFTIEGQVFHGANHYIDLFTGAADSELPGSSTFLPDVSTTSSFPFVEASGLYRSALIVTVGFAVISVFFETIIGFGQALVLDKEYRGRRWVRAAIIIPWAIPVVIQGMIFYLMFHPRAGFLTDWLADYGIVAATNTLNDPASAFLIVLVGDIWKTTAFMALLILAGLQSIDRSLYDVAKVSGASRWQQFKYITLPLVLPALGIAVLFRMIGALRVYGLIDSVSSCTTVPSLSCMVVSTYQLQRGLSSAIAFITAGIIAIAVVGVLYQQYKEGI